MSFSDSDWTREAAAPTPGGRRDAGWAWALLLGIVIGAAGASLVFVMLERPQAAPSPVLASRPTTPSPVLPPPRASTPATLLEAAPPAAGPTAPPASPPASPAATAAPAALAAAPRPSAEEQRRKERAWAAFYRRPASCEGNPTTDQLIDCANHFIRSKREFDERWKAGTL